MNMGVRWIMLFPLAIIFLVVVATMIAITSSPDARRAAGKVFGAMFAGLLGIGLLLCLILLARTSVHEQPPPPEVVQVQPYPKDTTLPPPPEKMITSPTGGEIPLSPDDKPPVVGVHWTRTSPDTKTKTRPAWVISPASVTSASKTVLHVGPESSPVALQNGMNQQVVKAANDFCTTQFGPFDRPIDSPLQVSANQLRASLISETYTETQERKVGSTGTEVPVVDQWVLVEFTPAARHMLETHWQSLVMTPRLELAAFAAGLLLACLGLVYGYLKIDQVTEGKSRTQLKLAVGAVILLVFGGLMLVAG